MSSPYERRSNARRLINLSKVRETLGKNKLLWVAPTVAFMVVGTLHALTKKDQWKASQALVVRDEAIGEMGFGSAPLGRFDSNDLLKRSLETILQISKNRVVAKAALQKVGPLRGSGGKDFPSEEDVEDLLDDISVAAPKGTEFGTSEVIYLCVDSTNAARAVNLTDAVCGELERRMKELRNDHATSIIAELTEKAELADRELQISTRELSEFEANLGSDLSELRALAESGTSGESILRSQVNQLKSELRASETIREKRVALHGLLTRIGNDPDAIVAAPNQLLDAQPSLRQLKDALIQAQLKTSRLLGSLTETHPRVQVALANEQNIRRQLLLEAKNSARSAATDSDVSSGLVANNSQRLSKVQTRLDRLAGKRAGYVNLTSKVSQRRDQLRQASVALAEAQGRLEAAGASSLITRLDKPVTGSKPVGPGRLTLIGGSTMGGLLLGLSLVYLLAPWQEVSRAGRRKSDELRRRATDAPNLQDRRFRPATPQLTDARPLQFQSLPNAVKLLPGTGSKDVEESLDHLNKIIESR